MTKSYYAVRNHKYFEGPLLAFFTLIVFLEVKSSTSVSVSRSIVNLKIIGGRNGTEGEFPSLVSLQMNPEFGLTYHYCAGTIFNQTHIISSAQCVLGRDFNQIQILAGAHILQADGNDSAVEQRRNVISVTLHPEFDGSTLRNDIALLQLNESLQFTARIQPAILSTLNTEYTGNCTIPGWGSNLTPGGPSVEPQFLQKVNMTRVSLSDCKSSYEFIRHVDETMVCARGEKEDAAQGPCSGDVGGPLLCTDAMSNATVLTGVMSWSMVPCGNSGYPSVFTNVTTLETI